MPDFGNAWPSLKPMLEHDGKVLFHNFQDLSRMRSRRELKS